MYQKQLESYFLAHKEELIRDTKRIVDINSERGEKTDTSPFGKGVEACFAECVSVIEQYGFQVKNHENYVLTVDMGPGERQLDILAHLDVVPAEDDWTVTEPFSMKVQNGRIYGRGTSDDKGPAMCAFYAMRAIRELNIPLKKSVRLILGGDEESGSGDLAYYFKKEKSAPMSFSPDADFPMINIEKGGLHSGFTSDLGPAEELPRVLYIHGGDRINVVPGWAEAIVEGLGAGEIMAIAAQLNLGTGISFTCKEDGNRTTILANGMTAHASTPEVGANAVTALMALLVHLPLSKAPVHEKLGLVHQLFPHGDYYGAALGVAMEDPESGKTTLSFNKMDFSEKGMEGMFDSRVSIAANDENTTCVIRERIREAGLEPMINTMYPPHYVDSESELVVKLLKAYERVTGKCEKPIAIGGGTYVHSIENGVAFGCAVPEVDNHMHGADEFMEIEQMLASCAIFANAIIEICG